MDDKQQLSWNPLAVPPFEISPLGLTQDETFMEACPGIVMTTGEVFGEDGGAEEDTANEESLAHPYFSQACLGYEL